MSIVSSYSPVLYSNMISRPEISSDKHNFSCNDTCGATRSFPGTSFQSDPKTGPIEFYRKRDIEMAWPDLYQNEYQEPTTAPNYFDKYRHVCSVVQESSDTTQRKPALLRRAIRTSMNPKTPDIFKAAINSNSNPLKAPSARFSPSFKGRNSNPYRRLPGKQSHVFFEQNFDTVADQSLKDSVLVSVNSTPVELTALNDKQEVKGISADSPILTNIENINYERNAATPETSLQPSECGKDTSSDFTFKPPEHNHQDTYPRCEFTIIEMEPNIY